MIGELLAFAAMLMFATNIIATKYATARVPVATGFVVSITVNTLFASLVLALQVAWQRGLPTFDAKGAVLFMLAGICATYLGRWFFFGAIARLGPARASFFHVASPAFTVAIAWIFLGEALRPLTLVAIVATIVGLLLVSTPPGALRAPTVTRTTSEPRGRWKAWIASGFAVGVGATLAYSVGNVLRGASIRAWNEPVAGVLLGAMAALALHLLVGSGHAQFVRGLRSSDRRGLALYAAGGVLTITAQMCMVASMWYIPVAVTTVITLATPLIVLPVSYWVMKNQERIGAATLAGAALTLGGIAVIVAV